MLESIIAFSIKNKLLIILFVIGLIVYGSYEVTQLPIDAVPDITNNQVQVITVTPSLGAPDVERLITAPIEQATTNIPGLTESRSFSRFGLSLITLVFNDKTDIYWARQQVSERLVQVQDNIPTGIGVPTMAPVTTGLGEIYQYVVRPKKGYEHKYTAMELRTIQDWVVRRQLMTVKGVAEVSSMGGYLKQYEVAINTAKMHAYQVTLDEVFQAVAANNQNTGGAYIERGPTMTYIRSEGLLNSIEDIHHIVVKRIANGQSITVQDVAEVHLGYATRYGAMCYNDKGEVAGAVVMMLKGASSSEVIKHVKEKIKQIEKTLPEGVAIEPFLDRTKMVNNAIGTVEHNLMEGCLIVIFILILFLGNFRAGFIVASVIPLSMLFAIIMMNLFGISGNLMSLGALDFGLIVDGAVIIVEAVMHSMAHSKHMGKLTKLPQSEMDLEVKGAASRMMNSAVFGQIIILIVYLPIFSLQGIEGKMFKPMAQTVAFALLGAFLLSVTYIPMISALLLDKKLDAKLTWSDRVMHKISHKFGQWLAWVMQHSKWAIGATVATFAVCVYLMSTLGGEFIPQLEEGDFAVETRLLTGSNLKTAVTMSQKVAKVLKDKYPEVEMVVTKIGSSEVPTDPMPVDAMDVIVKLKDKSTWTSAQSFPEMAEKMQKDMSVVPGLTFGFQYPVQMRFNELMTGARQDVVCKIFGENLDTLAKYASKLGQTAAKIAGAKDLFVETITGVPQIVIQYNRPIMAQYGVDIAHLNRIINASFAGQVAGIVYEGDRRFDLVLRLSDQQRASIQDVQQLLVDVPNGLQMPLSTFAQVSLQNSANQIQREDANRRIVVGFNVRGRDVQSIVQELQTKAANLHLPVGYYITYGGAFENLMVAKERLSIAVPIALILIFLMLYFAFASVQQGVLIFSAIPLSAIGGILALYFTGLPFSISAGVGFIALFGVAVLNGIVLIAEFNRLKSLGNLSPSEIALLGTKVRLRPVLMTAAVASLGFLPMALSNGAGAEVQRPLATVVIGGLLSATFLTLFLLPILYTLVENRALKVPKIIVLLILGLFLGSDLKAQSVASNARIISLDEAIDTLKSRNLQWLQSAERVKYHEQMQQKTWSLPATNLTAELGHVNSAYNDSKFGVSQSIKFPVVYKREHSVLQSNWQVAKADKSITEAKLIRQFSELYATLQYLKEKQKLLKYSKELIVQFAEKAQLRFEQGAANIAEQMTAQNQLHEISIQYDQLVADQNILLFEMNQMLGNSGQYDVIPFQEPMKVASKYNGLEPHSTILAAQERYHLAQNQLLVSKAYWMPEVSLGMYNQSFAGWQKVDNADMFFTKSNRFNSIQLSLGLPLFARNAKASIRAQQCLSKEAYWAYEEAILQHAADTYNAYLNYELAKQTYKTYEVKIWSNADTLLKTVDRQYAAGELDFLSYVQLLHQGIQYKSAYLEAQWALNKAIIHLNFLNRK